MKRRDCLRTACGIVAAGLLGIAACEDATEPVGPDEFSGPAQKPLIQPDRMSPESSRKPGPASRLPNLVVVVGNDSTNEHCISGTEWCTIQGNSRPAGGFVGIACTTGPGTCGTGFYAWSLQNKPPHTSYTVDPDTTAIDEATRLEILSTDSTEPGVYQVTVVPTALPGTPPVSSFTIPVHVLCSFRLGTCPQVEIFDRDSNRVVSAPAPIQNTLIGRRVRLLLRPKPGTDTSKYTFFTPQWNGTGSVVKSYSLADGRLTPLTPADLSGDSLSLYYYVPTTTSYTVFAEQQMRRKTDGAFFFPEARARYSPKGPTNVQLRDTTSAVMVGRLVNALSPVFLSFGNLQSLPTTAGIRYHFTATAPANDPDGIVGMTQLIKSSSAYDPSPTSTPVFPQTGGAFYLDNCPLYFPGHTTNLQGRFEWTSMDVPGSPLGQDFDALTRRDDFSSYFMYRPGGDGAIWVPLGRATWFWEGSTTRTAPPNPQTDGWTVPVFGVDANWSINPSGAAVSVFPTWPDTLVNPGGVSCVVVPGS